MLKYYKLFVFVFIQQSIFGQTEFLEGNVIADSLQGYAINIVNMTKKIGTTNDKTGNFKIAASVNDSIIFSSVQYKVLSLTVVDEHLREKQSFYLEPIIEELPEINFSNINLSGNIEKDAKNVEIKPYVNNQNLGLPFKDIKQPTQAERKLYTATRSSGFVSVDYIINLISGKIKKLKRNKRIDYQEKRVKRARKVFVDDFFIEDLGIPKEYIDDFIYYSSEDKMFEVLLQPSSKLNLLKFLEQKSKEYKEYKEF